MHIWLKFAVVLSAARLAAQEPSFPGAFIQRPTVRAAVAERECLSLGEDMFDKDIPPVGTCRALGFSAAGHAANLNWVFGTFERHWLLTASDTVAEREVVLFTKRLEGDSSVLKLVWHYRYEASTLASVTPEVASVTGGGVLLSIRECVNGTGGCSQSFALLPLNRAPKKVRLAFLDSLNRRFPNAIRHGFRVYVRTLRGSVALYSDKDANCCPSTIGEFSLRLRGNALELATLKLRRPD